MVKIHCKKHVLTLPLQCIVPKKSGQLSIVPMLVLEMWRDETGNDAKRLHNFEMFWKQVRAFLITMILIYNDEALKHVKKTWFLQHPSTTSLELPTFLLPCHLTVRQRKAKIILKEMSSIPSKSDQLCQYSEVTCETPFQYMSMLLLIDLNKPIYIYLDLENAPSLKCVTVAGVNSW